MMKKIILIAVLFLGISVNAQWNPDTSVNTLVADSDSADITSIATSDGQTYIVFWKVVAPPTNYELRLQLLDVDGNKQFGDDGMLISDTIPMSTFTYIWSITIDINDNLYVGVTGSGDDSGHAFKIDLDGNNLWGANGIDLGSPGFSVTILPLASGEALISWFPFGTGLVQKYDASGNPIWGSAQDLGTGTTAPADMYELSDGGHISVYHLVGTGINSTLYAQRYNSDGIAQWGSPTQMADRTTAFNRPYGGLQDGDNVYYGYHASSGSRFDSYLQRINPDGSLPWGINGTDFDTNETDYEQETKIAFSPGSQNIWSICTYTDSSQGQGGEFVQKFDKDSGARQFTDNAKEVYPIDASYIRHTGSLHLVEDRPIFLVTDGDDLNVVLLDTNGDFEWQEEQKPVATFATTKSRVHFNEPIDGQAVAVFVENKGAGTKIYAQNFTDSAILSTDEFASNGIRFANPINDQLVIHSDAVISSVTVYDILGQLIYNNSEANANLITINSEHWNSGMYLMTVTTNEGVIKGLKIIK